MTFMDVPLLLQEASGQLGESRSFAEKGHFRSVWIRSPISIPGPPWEPGLTRPLFPADRLCVREVSGFRNSNWMSLTPPSFLPGRGPRSEGTYDPPRRREGNLRSHRAVSVGVSSWTQGCLYLGWPAHLARAALTSLPSLCPCLCPQAMPALPPSPRTNASALLTQGPRTRCSLFPQSRGLPSSCVCLLSLWAPSAHPGEVGVLKPVPSVTMVVSYVSMPLCSVSVSLSHCQPLTSLDRGLAFTGRQRLNNPESQASSSCDRGASRGPERRDSLKAPCDRPAAGSESGSSGQRPVCLNCQLHTFWSAEGSTLLFGPCT